MISYQGYLLFIGISHYVWNWIFVRYPLQPISFFFFASKSRDLAFVYSKQYVFIKRHAFSLSYSERPPRLAFPFASLHNVPTCPHAALGIAHPPSPPPPPAPPYKIATSEGPERGAPVWLRPTPPRPGRVHGRLLQQSNP